MPMTTPGPRYTLKDVADRAGVAVSTASLVFSGKRFVADATRARVLKAAEDLDYGGPNPLASSLRQGRTGIVGVFAEGRLLNSFSDPFAMSVLDGVAQRLGVQSSGILLIPAQGTDEKDVVRHMSGLPLDAVIFPLGGHVSGAVLEHLRGRRIPLVGAGYPQADGVTQLRMDEGQAMRDIAQHLFDLGHRNVGLIELPAGSSRGDGDPIPNENPEAQARTAAFRELFPEATVIRATGSSIEAGFQACQELFEKNSDVTAVAAQSDLLAVGTIQFIGSQGLTTPDDVSVTGFDGIALPWLTGTLTTIDQHGHAKGRALAEMVLDALEGNTREQFHHYDFVAGSSSRPPASSARGAGGS